MIFILEKQLAYSDNIVVSVPDEERDLTTKATARPGASKSAASLVSENPTYNELPSSPDEPARRPLLQVGPSNEETEHEE